MNYFEDDLIEKYGKLDMIRIWRREGWELNPDDKTLNAILNRLEVNDGECPCHNPGKTLEDRLCPCKEYRENDICHCTLYVKKSCK